MLIGPVACTMASISIGNMIRKESFTSPCQSMSPTPYMNSNTSNPKFPHIHHTGGNAQTIEQQRNGPRYKLHYLSYHNRNKNESK